MREVVATLIKSTRRQGCVTDTDFSDELLNVQFVCNGGLGNTTVRFDQAEMTFSKMRHQLSDEGKRDTQDEQKKVEVPFAATEPLGDLDHRGEIERLALATVQASQVLYDDLRLWHPVHGLGRQLDTQNGNGFAPADLDDLRSVVRVFADVAQLYIESELVDDPANSLAVAARGEVVER